MKNISIILTSKAGIDYAYSMEELMASKRCQDFDSLLLILQRQGDRSYAKVKALYALGCWGDAAAVLPICRAIASFNELERIVAVDSLSRLAPAQALDTLFALQQDPSTKVQQVVAKVLAQLMQQPAMAAALKALQAKQGQRLVDESLV